VTLLVPPVSFNAMESNLATPAATMGTLVAADALAHTKNATYTELIASTAFDTCMVMLMMSDVGGTNTVVSSMLVDIAIGAAAAETVVIPNLNAGYAAIASAGGVSAGQRYLFPLRIPAGSRLSATAQAAVAGDDVRVAVWLYGKPSSPVWVGETVTAYGADLAASQGVVVASGTSGSEGAWTQIVASTTRAHRWLSAGVGGAGDGSLVNSHHYLDIGVGAATEQAIVTELPFSMGDVERITCHVPHFIQRQIPAGERLAARVSQNTATAQSADVILYGVS